jgi:CubicO group peptidase (beta-lactamase class C family)
MGGVAILFACSTTRQAGGAIAEPRVPQEANSLYGEIHRVGVEATQKNAVPGVAVALIQDGKIAWIQCIGYADVASKKPVQPQTIFNVGSVSKMVAAWGFMQLVRFPK